MVQVTVWQRLDTQKGKFYHNHLEDGHVPDDQMFPTPKCASHERPWSRGTWRAYRGYLIDGVVELENGYIKPELEE